MEPFAQIAHQQRVDVIVVAHDHRTLVVFDRTLEAADGVIRFLMK